MTSDAPSPDSVLAVPDDRGYEALRLDNQLCFGLYAAAHAMTRAYRFRLGALGLTYPQYLTLLALWEQDAQSVSELGRRLRLDSGTLTPLLKRMETAGLLARSRSRADEREVEVTLTARGQALRDEATGVRAGVVCQLAMSDEEIGRLRRDIDLVIERLDAASPDRVPGT
ncbi:MarR family winged helix-turn-helix transcriptional regulator [Hansschlegelia sp. KR7-227]|jgi:DNA-binding MarR family transcriptional regulator|uniref:MarR family winged helix-turn-helix transcriptional regulator n=1 Tax=Hansschlegelia sp. KR7-227 TaxID=3400914 RepID=UPI003C0A1108